MKKYLALLILLLSSESMALGGNLPHPYDYGMHAMGGYIIADGMRHWGFTDLEILATVAAIGIAKELTDKNFDGNDAAAWMPGVIIRFSIPLD